MTDFIWLDHVSKRYALENQVVVALDHVDLKIQRGEFLAIVGPSGSGKSTLLHLLGSIDTPTEGQYLLEGNDISKLSDRDLSTIRTQYFGFIFQDFNLLPDMTALENVELPMKYAGIPAAKRKVKARAKLEAVGLGARVHHRPTQLSGGQQQRTAIARALANDPIVIFADEPTGNLPQETGGQILDLLTELNALGMTIIMVTHDPQVAARASRQIRVQDGKIIRDQLQY